MVAPGFRSRIATGLLVAAVVLPVPVGSTPAAASDWQDTPVDRSPDLIRPGDPPDIVLPEILGPAGFVPDDFGAEDRLSDLSPAAGLAGLFRGHAGHPGAPTRFRELPDRFPGLPYGLPGFPHRPHLHPGHGRWHHRPHHPFGPGSPPYAASHPGDGGTGLRDASDSRADRRDVNRVHPRPGRRGASPKRRAAARPKTPASAAARPSPARRTAAGERHARHHDEALPPLPTPSSAQKGSPTPGSTDDEAVATPGPYAMEAPPAPVERVLPMGAGLALTGLGLAFLGLRLRRH
ncbi:hypothetical protein AB0C96_01570 [Streptomyces sp. NPDC048506]|uniref:hypothetical protein n=1 Tax=Streptomyces sp. NPDC048506 TaxID=3155028 RepID=UPI003431E085